VSTVFDDILAERHCGSVHCGTAEADSLEGIAAAFGLATDAAIYREIDRGLARSLIIELLHHDLAYRSALMSLERATDLADGFLLEAAPGACRYFSNMAATDARAFASDARAWNPATAATFDTGVLIVGGTGAACLWVEDED